MCFENGAHSGYTTEKIVQAFAARTVPIYWGDPNIGKVFNKEAFIDAYSFENTEKLVEFIEKVDSDDELYLKMLKTPALLTSSSIEDERLKFEEWLIHIFEQPLEKAYRRNRELHGRGI